MLDTPGHVDFSTEMSVPLQVLDYAILVISVAREYRPYGDLVEFALRYRIPTFIFINKMDLDGTDRHKIMEDIRSILHEGCVDFSENQDSRLFMEDLAVCDENILNHYLEHGIVETEDIAKLIYSRKTFPCYFGSALKQDGVKPFIKGLKKYSLSKEYPDSFAAKAYKVSRDDQVIGLLFKK